MVYVPKTFQNPQLDRDYETYYYIPIKYVEELAKLYNMKFVDGGYICTKYIGFPVIRQAKNFINEKDPIYNISKIFLERELYRTDLEILKEIAKTIPDMNKVLQQYAVKKEEDKKCYRKCYTSRNRKSNYDEDEDESL